jgi:signal transduction histidine kinase
VESTSNFLERNPSNTAQAIADLDLLRKEIQVAIEGVRTLAHSLHPPELELLGLAGALRERAQNFNQPGSRRLHVDVEIEEPLLPLPAAVESTVYYIAQEALTNVSRHSGADSCRLQLRLQRDVNGVTGEQRILELEIRDNGSGLPADTVVGKRAGLGLSSMRERVAELGGRCLIETLPAGGTRVEVRLPCTFRP